MYRETIVLDSTLDENILCNFKKTAIEYHNNRVGTLKNISEKENVLIFQGENENAYEIMSLGSLNLYDNKDFVSNVISWTFEDTECPEDNCNILEAYKCV